MHPFFFSPWQRTSHYHVGVSLVPRSFPGVCECVCAFLRVCLGVYKQVQMGIPVIPKSINPEHLAQNMDLFSWTLSDQDMTGVCYV